MKLTRHFPDMLELQPCDDMHLLELFPHRRDREPSHLRTACAHTGSVEPDQAFSWVLTDNPSHSQGYDGDHPNIDLLRLRNYTIGRNLTEAEVLSNNSLDRVADLLSTMKPFVSLLLTWLSEYLCERTMVVPNLNLAYD